MYCILAKYTVADQIVKIRYSRHIFIGGFTTVTKKSANPDIRRRLGRLHVCCDVRNACNSYSTNSDNVPQMTLVICDERFLRCCFVVVS